MDSLEQWVRLTQNTLGMMLVMLAMTFCFALWRENRSLTLGLGAMTFLALIPLLIIRICAVPEPPLLPQEFIAKSSLIINAFWPLVGLAWLASMLRDRLLAIRLRRKYGLNGPSKEHEE